MGAGDIERSRRKAAIFFAHDGRSKSAQHAIPKEFLVFMRLVIDNHIDWLCTALPRVVASGALIAFIAKSLR